MQTVFDFIFNVINIQNKVSCYLRKVIDLFCLIMIYAIYFFFHFLMNHNLSQTPYWHKTCVIQSQLNSFLLIIRICLHKTLMLNINLRNGVKWKSIESDYDSVMCPDLSMKTYFLQDYCSSVGAYLSRIETKDENDWIVDIILPAMNQGKCW